MSGFAFCLLRAKTRAGDAMRGPDGVTLFHRSTGGNTSSCAAVQPAKGRERRLEDSKCGRDECLIS